MSLDSNKVAVERLKSKKTIELLFKEGTSLFVFPLKLIYHFDEPQVIERKSVMSCGFSVPKRLHSKATTRNLLKRRLRETCRLFLTNEIATHHILQKGNLNIMFILIDKEVTDFHVLKRSMIRLRKKLLYNLN